MFECHSLLVAKKSDPAAGGPAFATEGGSSMAPAG
jgi:hypothetical protein